MKNHIFALLAACFHFCSTMNGWPMQNKTQLVYLIGEATLQAFQEVDHYRQTNSARNKKYQYRVKQPVYIDYQLH